MAESDGGARATEDDLLAEGEPEAEFVAGVAARMPRKRVAAGLLLRDARGRVLLVEPRYKPTWDIPGGVVEPDESPLAGCRREVAEELGLRLDPGRLLVVDWMPRHGVWHDSLAFVFDGGRVDDATAARLAPADGELAAVRFTHLDDAAGRLRPSMLRRLQAAVAVADGAEPGPAYLEFARRALPR